MERLEWCDPAAEAAAENAATAPRSASPPAMQFYSRRLPLDKGLRLLPGRGRRMACVGRLGAPAMALGAAAGRRLLRDWRPRLPAGPPLLLVLLVRLLANGRHPCLLTTRLHLRGSHNFVRLPQTSHPPPPTAAALQSVGRAPPLGSCASYATGPAACAQATTVLTGSANATTAWVLEPASGSGRWYFRLQAS